MNPGQHCEVWSNPKRRRVRLSCVAFVYVFVCGCTMHGLSGWLWYSAYVLETVSTALTCSVDLYATSGCYFWGHVYSLQTTARWLFITSLAAPNPLSNSKWCRTHVWGWYLCHLWCESAIFRINSINDSDNSLHWINGEFSGLVICPRQEKYHEYDTFLGASVNNIQRETAMDFHGIIRMDFE